MQNKPRKFKLLLLEHESELSKILEEDLSELFDVTVFTNAKDALRYLEHTIPDIIVSDLYLISNNEEGIEAGLKFLKAVKSRHETQTVPIVILSKYGDIIHPISPENLEKYRKEGMRWGPGKRYSWRDLITFQKELERLNIDSSKIYNKLAYEDNYKSFALELRALLKVTRSDK